MAETIALVMFCMLRMHLAEDGRNGGTVIRNLLFSIASFALGVSVTIAQQPQSVIRIKLLNGLNGNPLKLTKVGLEISPGYRELDVQTDQNGVAAISISKDSTILTHNTKLYVACADEPGGLVHNEFKVSEILLKGIVQPVAKPNRCSKTTSTSVPGELVLFVRPWEFLENNPL